MGIIDQGHLLLGGSSFLGRLDPFDIGNLCLFLKSTVSFIRLTVTEVMPYSAFGPKSLCGRFWPS
jgi:hypothetical protein